MKTQSASSSSTSTDTALYEQMDRLRESHQKGERTDTDMLCNEYVKIVLFIEFCNEVSRTVHHFVFENNQKLNVLYEKTFFKSINFVHVPGR